MTSVTKTSGFPQAPAPGSAAGARGAEPGAAAYTQVANQVAGDAAGGLVGVPAGVLAMPGALPRGGIAIPQDANWSVSAYKRTDVRLTLGDDVYTLSPGRQVAPGVRLTSAVPVAGLLDGSGDANALPAAFVQGKGGMLLAFADQQGQINLVPMSKASATPPPAGITPADGGDLRITSEATGQSVVVSKDALEAAVRALQNQA